MAPPTAWRIISRLANRNDFTGSSTRPEPGRFQTAISAIRRSSSTKGSIAFAVAAAVGIEKDTVEFGFGRRFRPAFMANSKTKVAGGGIEVAGGG